MILKKYFKILIHISTLVLVTLFSLNAFAKGGLTIVEGPASHETAPDMENQTMTVNFEYWGCDPNPSAKLDDLKIRPSFECVSGQSYELEGDNGKTERPYFGETGQVTFEYDYAPDNNCEEKDMNKSYIRGVYPLDFFYKGIQARMEAGNKNLPRQMHYSKRTCNPVALTFVDSPRTPKGKKAPDKSLLHRYNSHGKLCDIPAKKITLPGFRTNDKESPMTQLSVKDDEFSFGDNTFYKFIPNADGSGNGKWSARFEKKDKAGNVIERKKMGANFDLSTPIPVMYEREGQVHLAATVKLNSDGTAEILSQGPGKKYPNAAAIRGDRKNFNKNNDKSKGKILIDMKAFGGKVSQTKVSAYDEKGDHLRTLNIVGRNLLGHNYKDSWCGQENCFRRGVQTENLCESKKTNEINMSYGGSDNVCYSCLGVTAGTCNPESESGLNDFRDDYEKAQKTNENRLAQTGKKTPLKNKRKDAFDELFKKSARTAQEKSNNECRVGSARDPKHPGSIENIMLNKKKHPAER